MMFENLFKRIDAFNELKGCEGKYTLIEKDGEIVVVFPKDDDLVFPTYKDKATYQIELIKPCNEWGKRRLYKVYG